MSNTGVSYIEAGTTYLYICVTRECLIGSRNYLPVYVNNTGVSYRKQELLTSICE